MIRKIAILILVAAAFGVVSASVPAQASSRSLAGSVMIQDDYTGLCVSSGHSAATTADGNQLLERACNSKFASQAWDFTSPGVITFAKNTALQAGWDAFGKMKLMASGVTFTYSAPGAPSGTFTAMDGTTTEYLAWNGVIAYPRNTPLRVTPNYLSFSSNFTIVPR